jgi:hypothetical protein
MHFGAEYPFIIGEYVPGGSIGSRIDAGDWPDEKEALAATIGALDGWPRSMPGRSCTATSNQATLRCAGPTGRTP